MRGLLGTHLGAGHQREATAAARTAPPHTARESTLCVSYLQFNFRLQNVPAHNTKASL